MSIKLYFELFYGTIMKFHSTTRIQRGVIRMKKLLISIGILITIGLLVACGNTSNDLDAMELLLRSQERTAEITDRVSSIIEMEAIVTMNMGIMEISMPMNMRMEIESPDRSRQEVSMSMMGVEMSIDTFTRDGYEYTRTNEFGEIAYTRTEVTAADSGGVFDNVDFDAMTDEWFEESIATETDGGYRLEFVYGTAGILAFLENFELDLVDVGEIDFDGVDLDDWNVTIIIYLDENYVQTSSTVTMFFETVMQEDDMSFDATLDITMRLTHQDVTINFPSWLDEISFD